MNTRILWRVLIMTAVTLFAALMFAGPKWDRDFFHNLPQVKANVRQNIRLGLDLRGGTQVVLQVKTEEAIRAETDQTVESVRTKLQTSNMLFSELARTADNEFKVVGRWEPTRDSEFRTMMDTTHPEWSYNPTSGEAGASTYMVRLKPQIEQQWRKDSVDQAINTIRKRVDKEGVTEPVIEKYGAAEEYEILVQFPDLDDLNRVTELIGKPAMLELKIVDGNPASSEQAILEQRGGVLPSGLQILPSMRRRTEGSGAAEYYLVRVSAGITGRDLRSASAGTDDKGRPAVRFTLTADGARKFGKLTGENVGKALAIILDGAVYSAPTLQSEIRESGEITGSFTAQEVQDQVLLLNSGALPASIKFLNTQVLGPSLGADSIRAGIYASLIALVAVVGFVLFYYRGAGINAMVAMVLNLLLLMGAMSYLHATLTLPGIAGVILTIGVGIDSNVLIFERIREELRAGKTAASAVGTSFKRVFITLVDTHLAALLSAFCLYFVGTGPVRGFAVTLVIGLISNMFTSVFVSRTLFELILSRKEREEALSI